MARAESRVVPSGKDLFGRGIILSEVHEQPVETGLLSELTRTMVGDA